VTDFNFIDSSIWINFAININNENADIINSDKNLLTSALSLFEVKKRLIKDKVLRKDIEKIIDFIKKRSLIINVEDRIAERAADLAIENNLPAMDSLIYASSLENDAELITLDNDFRGLKNVSLRN